MDQEAFLGHQNLNAVTIPLSGVQNMQTQFWMDVFVAAIRDGNNTNEATIKADKANEKFKERFITC